MNFTQEQLNKLQEAAKERTVRTQTVEYGMDTIVKRIDDNIIKLNPDYQRHHRWSDEASSRLIESIILNIPIPYIYISRDIDVDEEVEDTARYTVIDGQQRLTAIYNFMKGNLRLSGLKALDGLSGVDINSLPSFLSRRLDERTIKCLIIDSTVDRQVKYDIFERLNTGSIELSNQEVRNAIYRGKFNEMIKDLAKYKNFKEMLYLTYEPGEDLSSKEKEMEDVEIVLRFFSFSYNEGYKEYNGDLKDFLNRKMDYFNKLDSETLAKIKKTFIETIDNIYNNLDEKWFAKYKVDNGVRRVTSKFNVSVYDAIAVASAIECKFDFLTRENLNKKFDSREFSVCLEGSTTDVKKVVARIDILRGLLRDGN